VLCGLLQCGEYHSKLSVESHYDCLVKLAQKTIITSSLGIDDGQAMLEVHGGGSPVAKRAIMVGAKTESCST